MKKLMINFVALCLLASVMITPGLAEHDELKPLPPVPHLLYTPEENQPLPLGYAVVISPNGGRLNIRDGEGVDCGSMMQVVAGTVLPYYSNPRAEWVKVKAGNQMGYVMSEYLYLGEDMARVRPDTQVLSV